MYKHTFEVSYINPCTSTQISVHTETEVLEKEVWKIIVDTVFNANVSVISLIYLSKEKVK